MAGARVMGCRWIADFCVTTQHETTREDKRNWSGGSRDLQTLLEEAQTGVPLSIIHVRGPAAPFKGAVGDAAVFSPCRLLQSFDTSDEHLGKPAGLCQAHDAWGPKIPLLTIARLLAWTVPPAWAAAPT